MNVHELIEILQKCDPDRIVVSPSPGFGGIVEETTVVYNENIRGLGHRLTFQRVRCVVLSNGNGEYMGSHGYDVVGFSDKSTVNHEEEEP